MSIRYHYKKFPPKLKLDEDVIKLIYQARTALGRYDGFLSSMRNSDILLSPLFTQEAVLSSRIEGTQSTLSEVLEFEAHQGEQKLPEEKHKDIIEILNYRSALLKATALLKEALIKSCPLPLSGKRAKLGVAKRPYRLAMTVVLRLDFDPFTTQLDATRLNQSFLKKMPLSERILLEAHKKLMQGARGKHKSPGKYRKIPVWIGPSKTDIKSARFIPIEQQHIPLAMSNFEKYIHNADEYDDLLKSAILHAEFEAIHPFLDGNGRLGRLFIPLYLWQKKLIVTPSFYMSAYFEKNRQNYYDFLLDISAHNGWLNWCKFFIKGIKEQSDENFKRAKSIVDFYQKLKEQIPTISKSSYGITALDFIFQKTYFNSTQFYQESNIPRSIAQRLLGIFEEEEILVCIRGKGKKANFTYLES